MRRAAVGIVAACGAGIMFLFWQEARRFRFWEDERSAGAYSVPVGQVADWVPDGAA